VWIEGQYFLSKTFDSSMWIYFFTFILSLALSLYITPMVRKGALLYDIVDRPDGKLKNHKRPVPYLGGLAVYLAFLFSIALTFELSQDVLGILLSGTIIAVLGIIDDLKALPPKIKVLGQCIAVFVLIKSGIYIQLVFFPNWLCILLSFFWLMAITNAFNIIDVLDGLAAGIGFFVASILFIVAVYNQYSMIAILAIALAGALLGFLRYNFAPAQIYLGDTGSMFIGLVLGALSMIGTYTKNNVVACVAPVVILGIPIFDMLFVMYIRWLRGMPVIYGSPDHFALRLRKWRLSTRQTAIISYAACLFLGLLSLIMVFTSHNSVSVGIMVIIITAGICWGIFLKRINMSF